MNPMGSTGLTCNPMSGILVPTCMRFMLGAPNLLLNKNKFFVKFFYFTKFVILFEVEYVTPRRMSLKTLLVRGEV